MSMKEWGAAWQEALLAEHSSAINAGGTGNRYAWAEDIVAAAFLAGWVVAILSGRL